MSMKDAVIEAVAAEMRIGTGEVRNIVNTYERTRTQMNRGKRKVPAGTVTRRGGKPKHIGGGYYTVKSPDNEVHKVRGKAAAEAVYAG